MFYVGFLWGGLMSGCWFLLCVGFLGGGVVGIGFFWFV